MPGDQFNFNFSNDFCFLWIQIIVIQNRYYICLFVPCTWVCSIVSLNLYFLWFKHFALWQYLGQIWFWNLYLFRRGVMYLILSVLKIHKSTKTMGGSSDMSLHQLHQLHPYYYKADHKYFNKCAIFVEIKIKIILNL